MNFFDGFRRFFTEENSPEKSNFMSTVKKQLRVPKAVWLGMPVMVYNAKIGGHKITTPTMFYVTDFDDDEVTIKSVAEPGFEDGKDEDDPDDEINMDGGDLDGGQEFTISREEFEKLSEPDVPPQGMGMGMGMI